MVRIIKERVKIQAGGLIEMRSTDLVPGLEADVIVMVEQPAIANSAAATPVSSEWRHFAGALKGDTLGTSDNVQIDTDLAREYGSVPGEDA